MDEAQRIKNWKTKVASSVKKIKSTYCVVLTGTPLENKLEELYSIVQFIDPFRLGPYYQFINRYQITNETGKVIGYQHLNEIGEMLKEIVLRRTKKDVLSQLPERMDKILFVPMTEAQSDMHEEFNAIVARLVQKWQRMGFLNEKDRQKLLINLNLMRMVCDSTYIVDQTTRHDTKINELMSILDEYFEQSDEKAVVFSQWERMTRLVAQELDTLGIKYEYLHGGVPSQKRKSLFDNFNNDPDCRVFLSTDAGSTGLNLQSASLLVNMDIPWNPAVLEQRVARIHRLGQKKNVSIVNFVSKGTIEERMLSVLGFKSSLAKGILDLGEDSIFMSDDKFKQFMQTVNEIADTTNTATQQTITEDEELEQVVSAKPEEKDGLADDNKAGDKLQDHYFEGDDDVETDEPEITEPVKKNETEPAQLLAQGLSFLSGLSKTLASPEKTAELVSSITEKDEKTGQTYLKIPVESQDVLKNVLSLVGQLFKSN
ncbi:MAG: DEAD/DEAH box helicase [Paludibacteraceae bacterium]